MVKIEIGPSRQLAWLLALAHGSAAAAATSIALPPWAVIGLLAAVTVSLVRSLWGPALLRSEGAVTALEIREGGAASIRTRAGVWHEARLLDTSFVSARLTVLNLGTDGSYFARHVVIMPDSVVPEDYRNLRVWLRWAKRTA